MRSSRRWIGDILWADFLVRVRKPATVGVFLFLCFSAYLWVPDPSAGYALISVQGQRVLYDSPAMAFATGVLFSLLITLFGFFIVKGSIGLDSRSRCGLVIASTPTASWEYLLGKMLGNVVFLTTLALGFMLSSMIMQLVRGEASLDPIPYLVYYALLVPPGIVFVSSVAVLFESTRRLASRAGEVLYLLVWVLLLGISIAWHTQGSNPGLYFDYTGVGFLEQMLRDMKGADGVSIGAALYDESKDPIVFGAARVETSWVLPRIMSTVTPVLLLVPATALFHRFDPSRTRLAHRRRSPGLVSRLSGLTRRPASLAFSRLAPWLGGRRSLTGAMVSEAMLILLLHPLAAATLGGLASVSAVAPLGLLTSGVLPAMFAILAVMISGVSSREYRSGTVALTAAIPGLERYYLWWKLGATLTIGLIFLAVPAIRVGFVTPNRLLSMVVGLLFTVGFSIALGAIARTPKAFLVLYLSFWYVVLNDGGRTALLDFAGFYGSATSMTHLLYVALAVLGLILAKAIVTFRPPHPC
jgi:hypothetical protein